MLHANADRDQILATLAPLCQGIDRDILQDFVTRMDPDYFSAFSPNTLAAHIKQAATLTPDHPCNVSIDAAAGGHFRITIVAYDYFSEFATICGLLSAFELNIEEGQIYTFVEESAPAVARTSWTDGPRTRPKGRPGLSRKKIVDVFRVEPIRGASFELKDRQRLIAELIAMIALLDANQFDEARQAVNRQLVEYLGQRRGSFSGLLHTVQITFDNSQSPTDTVMDIQSDDTPAFLYAFANALAMRNIYIAKAQFAIEGGKLHDRFYVRNRHGQKLTDPADQQHLRLTAVLIKQFTHALTWAPDPARLWKPSTSSSTSRCRIRRARNRNRRSRFSATRKPSPSWLGCSAPVIFCGRTSSAASTAISCRCCSTIAMPAHQTAGGAS
ncbi:MAG: hypothetical protein IPI70_12870 [Nitrospira sp.]|nr:hypothetical protein [Nitrospira sp.]